MVMLWVIIIIFLMLLIALPLINYFLIKGMKKKIVWIILSCALPVIIFGVYFRYEGQKILEETLKLADLMLELFRFRMIIECAGLIFLLQLIMLIRLVYLREKAKSIVKDEDSI